MAIELNLLQSPTMVLQRPLKSYFQPLELFAKFNSPSAHAAILIDVMMRGFDFSSAWVRLHPLERVRFQTQLDNKNKHCRILSHYIHFLNCERYSSLTDQEKTLFFNGCKQYLVPKQYERRVVFGLIDHVAKMNVPHIVDAKKAITRVYKWKKWSKEEMKQFISFCNRFNFFIVDLKTTLRELTKSSKNPFQTSAKQAFLKKYDIEQLISKGIRTFEEWIAAKGILPSDLFVMGAQNLNDHLPAQQMLRFLSTAPASFVAENTTIAVQLMMTEAMRGHERMLKESVVVLKSLNVSRISMQFFSKLTFHDANFKFFQPFVDVIRGDHDHMLASASFEQTEAFYRPLESDLKVNDDFLKQHKEIVAKLEKGREPIPSLPKGVEISFDELLEMYQKLNFTDCTRSDYIDLTLLELHQKGAAAEDRLKGSQVTPKELKEGIENLVLIAKKPRGYHGFPNKNEKDRQLVFGDYDLYLKHVILKLKTCSESDRNTSLVWLAAAGLHCGSAHLSVAEYLYYRLVDATYNPDLHSLKDVLVQYVTEARRGVVNDRLNRVTTETHSRVAVMRDVGKKLGLPEADTYQFEDDYRYSDPHFQEQSKLNRFLVQCREDLSATHLINIFVQRFDGFPGNPPTISANFRVTKLNPWFAAQYPKKNVYNDEITRLQRRYVVQLLLSHGVLQLGYTSWNVFKAWKSHYWEPSASTAV